MVWLKKLYYKLVDKFGSTFNDTLHFQENVIVVLDNGEQKKVINSHKKRRRVKRC